MTNKQSFLMPVIGRQGNKYLLLKKIIPLIPEHTTYVEPFTGSGVVWLNKEPADKSVLNDLDPQIKKIFTAIKNAPSDITKYKRFDTRNEAQQFYDKTPTSPADKLHHLKIKQMGGFATVPIKNKVNEYGSWNFPPHIIERSIPMVKELLKHTTVLNKDYVSVIKKYDSPNTFFFIDPPYKGTSAGLGYAQGNEFDYDILFNTLDNLKGMFLLTINDLPEFRKQYKNYRIKKVVAVNQRDDSARKELFIMNYEF